MPLAAFSPDTITFTYPDSMASLALGRSDDHAAIRRSYHGQVFTLPEIRDIVARFGMPDGGQNTAASISPFDRFVEVQVWDDRPCVRALAEVSAASRSAVRV